MLPADDEFAEKKTLLTALSGGGFTFETRCLLQAMQGQATFYYLGQPLGGRPGTGGLPEGKWYEVPMFATVTNDSKIASVRAFITTFLRAFQVLRHAPIQAVVGVGSSHLVPMFLAARLLRRKTIYIESITRADILSNTGRLVYALRLADTFLVQWPELAGRYPRARLGSIL